MRRRIFALYGKNALDKQKERRELSLTIARPRSLIESVSCI